MTDQAAEQSVMDRLTSHMEHLTGQTNDPPQTEAESTETAEAPAFEEIEWEGEKYQLPSKIKDALMKNSDYTQKTQQLAEQRKQVEHIQELAKTAEMQQAFTHSVAAEQQELAVIEAYLQQASKVDWSKMTTEQMLRTKVEIDTVKERRDAVKSSLTDKRSAFEKEVSSKFSELRGKAKEFAAKTITGFTDETDKAVRSYAASEGLSESQIDRVLADPISYKVLWKASQYDKVASGVKGAQAQVQKTLKPSGASNKMPEDVRAKLDYGKAIKTAKTSSQKAQVIETRLAKAFGG